jgi:hypothetical protein
MHVAGLSPRTSWTARSPPRCRRSSCWKICAPAPRAITRCTLRPSIAAGHARSPRGSRADVTAGRRVWRSDTPRRRYRRQRAAFREGGSTACVLRGSRCGRMRQAAALLRLAAPRACAQLAEQQPFSRGRPDGARQFDQSDRPVRPILGRWHGRCCTRPSLRHAVRRMCAVRCAGDSASIT